MNVGSVDIFKKNPVSSQLKSFFEWYPFSIISSARNMAETSLAGTDFPVIFMLFSPNLFLHLCYLPLTCSKWLGVTHFRRSLTEVFK
jgi:hypothetical protein